MATKKGGSCPSGAGPRDDQNGGLAVNADLDNGGVIVPISGGEVILRGEKREISILLARKEVTIIHALSGRTGSRPARSPRAHRCLLRPRGRTDVRDRPRGRDDHGLSGGFVAAPPGVAHSLRNDSDRPTRWLTIHAHDGGFAAFMRGTRDGVKVDWDIAPVPTGGGLPASQATVSPRA